MPCEICGCGEPESEPFICRNDWQKGVQDGLWPGPLQGGPDFQPPRPLPFRVEVEPQGNKDESA